MLYYECYHDSGHGHLCLSSWGRARQERASAPLWGVLCQEVTHDHSRTQNSPNFRTLFQLSFKGGIYRPLGQLKIYVRGFDVKPRKQCGCYDVLTSHFFVAHATTRHALSCLPHTLSIICDDKHQSCGTSKPRPRFWIDARPRP